LQSYHQQRFNMSEPSIECQYFKHIAEYSVAACRECRYAVWPDQIEGHLQEQHKISRKEAETVGEQIRSWAGLIQYPSELEIPSNIPKPVQYKGLRKGCRCLVNKIVFDEEATLCSR
jgi:hypothetical protein